MGEITTPLIPLKEGVTYTPGPDEYVITPLHSVADIIRHLQKEGVISEVKYLVNQFEYP